MTKFRLLYTYHKDGSKDTCYTRRLVSAVQNEPIIISRHCQGQQRLWIFRQKTRGIQKPNPFTLGLSTFLIGFFVAAFLKAFIQLRCFGVRRISMDPQTSIYKWRKKDSLWVYEVIIWNDCIEADFGKRSSVHTLVSNFLFTIPHLLFSLVEVFNDDANEQI